MQSPEMDVNRDFRLLSASLYQGAKSTDPLSPFVSHFGQMGLMFPSLTCILQAAVKVQKVLYLSNNIRPSSCMPPKRNLESLSALVLALTVQLDDTVSSLRLP